MGSYRLTRAAADDLADIHFHGMEVFGLSQADDYHDGLEAAFRFLASYPRAARLREELRYPVRVYPCKAHLVFYEIIVDDDIVILRVRHSREDWMND